MKVVFVTAHPLTSSTAIGRVVPLVKHFATQHEVTILAHESERTHVPDTVKVQFIGHDPFTRGESGKTYKKGFSLIWQMLRNAWNTLLMLVHIQPDVAVVVKPLPQNVFATFLWTIFNSSKKIILDVDDFELVANKLTSIYQRLAIHWAERIGVSMSDTVVVATPFLADHFEQLSSGKKKPVHIPTALPFTTELAPYPDGSHVIAYIGSISHHSGHRTDMLPEMLRAVRKRIPDATLRMIGSGDNIEELKQLFSDAGLADAVTWTGRFSLDDIPELLKDVALLVDPVDASIVNRAKSSFRVALAAEAGLPVITSDIGIRPMLLPHNVHQTMFAAPADTADYAQKSIHFLEEPLPEQIRLGMSVHAKRFTWDKLGAKYLGLIQ